MNRVLFKAAAIVNIAAAALIYVACSGDDGKDGAQGAPGLNGTSCTVQLNVAGNYDIICGDAIIGQLNQGPPGPQGLPGTAVDKGDPGDPCTGANVAPSATYPNGGVNITCANGTFFVSNGAAGTGGAGGCSVIAETVLATGDQGITLRCPPDQRSATIIICGGENPSTGLLIDDEGRVGQCKADGTISRTGAVQMLACGQAQFDPKKEFCQRTISTAGPNLGDWASTNTSGAVVKGNYPATLDGITNPESQYNSSNLQPGVSSVILPLCGSYPAATDAQVLSSHTGHVYNALQYCGRTLVVKIGEGTSRYSVSDGSTLNGKPVAGGALDNDPKNPNSPAWKVLAKGQCAIDLVSAEKISVGKINGFNFTTTGTGFDADKITRDCSWMEAVTTATDPVSTYCPETADVVALDDVKCVPRTATTGGCIYHSTIDKTCLVQESDVSLYGVKSDNTAADRAKITAAYKTGTGGAALPPSEWTYAVSPVNGSGIKRTPVGSRFGLGLKPLGALTDNGNLWSKACVTLTRTVYIAVNDQYLSNKGFKESNTTVPTVDAQGPLCAGDIKTPASGSTPAVLQEAVAFENAVACLDGTLSLDVKVNGQPIPYDGTSWDKPLFCVRSNYGLTAICKITAPSIVDQETCGNIDGFYQEASRITTLGLGTGSWVNDACVLTLTPAISGTATEQSVCESITSATRAQTNPLGGTGVVTAKWINPSGNTWGLSDHISTPGACQIESDATELLAGATVPTKVLDKDRCEGIKELTYGLSANKVPGIITGSWRNVGGSLATPSSCTNSVYNDDEDGCKDHVGTCTKTSTTGAGTPTTAAQASLTDKAACLTDDPGTCTGSSTTAASCATENSGAETWTINSWATTPGAWTDEVPSAGGTNYCVVTSDYVGAVAANNCAWINRANASEAYKFTIPNATPIWGAN